MLPEWVTNLQKDISDAEMQSKYSSKEDIEQLIRDINFKIDSELTKSFLTFKKQLTQKLIEKQTILFDSLKQTINSLARDFEDTLKKSLHINLDIVELSLDSIDSMQALDFAEAYIDRFVKSNLQRRMVQKTEKVYNPEKYCWVIGGYDKRIFWDEEITIKTQISKAGLELFWKNMIDERNISSKKVANFLFDKNIKQQIRNARNSFNSYVDDYMTTIHEQKALLSSGNKLGITKRLEGLKILSQNTDSIIEAIAIV